MRRRQLLQKGGESGVGSCGGKERSHRSTRVIIKDIAG